MNRIANIAVVAGFILMFAVLVLLLAHG
jgi:hypothetical protein